ncbi:iridoid oxidase-like isoform X1 [Diospyros lotus]|uniref:iridoid oxidase-like isoform X1 n=1 Tax=Diospyros lotus TaxID=55363 RepID=UPI00225BC917|nr:iridoid oxidase-like isoform X1 [Diospyros lotus]
METTFGDVTFVITVFLLSATLLLLISRKKTRTGRPPPGPPGWPVFGNMFDLGSMSHQTLHSLRTKYGPVIWLRLGSMNTLVVQSAMAAAELFKYHDLDFPDRKVPDALTAWNYHEGGLSLNSYSPYWRLLRRLYSAEFLSAKRINDTAAMRRKCVDNLVKWIEAANGGEVDIGHLLFVASFNLVGNLVLSRDVLSSESEEGFEFFDAMNNVMELGGKANLADYFPFLRRLDPAGMKREMVREMGRARRIVEKFVKDRIEEKKSGREINDEHDLLDVLLNQKGDAKDPPVPESKAINAVLEMFFAGSETTSSSTEWAMAELLQNPSSMRKVKAELDRVIGRSSSSSKVEEGQLEELQYLQAVVKETLRLHPAVPLLLPRNAVKDTDFMGYFIPKDTQVLVNVWGIGRDGDSWDEPSAFRPERFIGSSVEYKGQNFELLPFGAGRRICVGYSLAHRTILLVLATLLHLFDWEAAGGAESVDMRERMGITLRKLVPLKVVPRRRAELLTEDEAKI